MEEGFTVEEISCMLSGSERTIYCRMERYGLEALNLSNISDDELDCHVTEVSKLGVSFFWRPNVEVSSEGKRHQSAENGT